MGLFSLTSLLGVLLFGLVEQGLLSEVPELFGLDPICLGSSSLPMLGESMGGSCLGSSGWGILLLCWGCLGSPLSAQVS